MADRSRTIKNKLMRRTFLAAAGVGLGAVAGCGRSGKRVIGVVPQGRTHLFWQTVQAGAIAASRELGVDISWNGPATESDFNGQLQIIDAMINRHVDALCMAPIDRTAMVSALERAVKQKIPVVIFDSGIASEDYTSWVATDNHLAGQMAAARVGELLGGNGKVAIVGALPGVASTTAREAGFEEKIKSDFPGITVADKRFGQADFAKSLAVAENMLTAIPDLGAFFASNESATVGTVQALKSRSSKVKLVGFDWSPALIDDLRSGLIDSVMAQDPFQIGYKTVTAAVNALDGKPVEKIQKLTPRLIRKDDLELPDVKKLLNPDLKAYLG